MGVSELTHFMIFFFSNLFLLFLLKLIGILRIHYFVCFITANKIILFDFLELCQLKIIIIFIESCIFEGPRLSVSAAKTRYACLTLSRFI